MTQAAGIGYHILADKMTREQKTTLLAHLHRLQPAAVNVTGAERYPESLDLVQQILDTCPNTLVFERRRARPDNQGGDEGIWELPLEQWYGWRVTPYLDVLRHPRVVVVYDNESLVNNLQAYAGKMADAAALANWDEVALGLGRFSSGTPGETQYAQLDAMWEVLHNSRHWWTPNEYAGPTAGASAGHLQRFVRGFARCMQLGIEPPRTAIGETGILVQRSNGALDSHRGYKSLGWTDEQCADAVIDNFTLWYQPQGVPVMYFVPECNDPEWADMAVGVAFYEQIERRMAELMIPWWWTSDKTEDGEIPMSGCSEITAKLINISDGQRLRVRSATNTAASQVGWIGQGDTICYLPPVQGDAVGDLGDQWVPVQLAGGQKGYAFAYYLDLPDDTEAPSAELLKARALAILDQARSEIEAL